MREARPVGNRVRFRFSIGRGASLASYTQGVDVEARPGPCSDLIDGSDLSTPQIDLSLGAPAPGAALEDVGVVEEAVEQSGDGGIVAEEFPPIVQRSVGRNQAAFFRGVSIQDDFNQIIGGPFGFTPI